MRACGIGMAPVEVVVDGVSRVKMDKAAFSVVSLADESDEREFWLGKPHGGRLEAMELLRQMNYGYDPDSARLQRIFEVAEFEAR